jgi:hypothetical protein
MNPITPQFTQQEAQAVLEALDAAVRSQGLRVAEIYLAIAFKMQLAMRAAQAPPTGN